MGARPTPVLLASIDWWKEEGHLDSALRMVDSGRMPLGGPVWDRASVQMLRDWRDNKFEEGPRPTDID
jgi:hypothetical protein